MGLRSGFVRSDDEDEEENARDKGGPSSREKKKRPVECDNEKESSNINQGSVGICCTSGKVKAMKRLKKVVNHESKEFFDDGSDEEYPTEVMLDSAIGTQRKNRKTENKRCYKKCATSKAEPSKSVRRRGGCTNQNMEESDSDFECGLDGYMEIQAKDIPERLHIDEIGDQVTLKGDWTVEANWIYDRLLGSLEVNSLENDFSSIRDVSREEIVQEIIFVLEDVQTKNYEIPYIGTYRYYGCNHLACKDKKCDTTYHHEESNTQLNQYKILWHVFGLHRKWLSLCYRKHFLEETYKKRVAALQDFMDPAKDLILPKILEDLKDAKSKQSINDLDAKFQLHFPVEAVMVDTKDPSSIGRYKRPKQHSYYSICCRSELGNLAKQFILTPEQLCENLQAKMKINEPPCLTVCPEEVDVGGFNGLFRDVDQVLRGARHVAAYELSCEPRIREFMRSSCSQQMVVSARLTEKGKSMIDSFPDWSHVKHVQAKPVVSFLDGEWLILQKAEKDNLLEVAIDIPHDVLNEAIMSRLEESYLSNGSTSEEKLWDQQRKEVLKEVINDILMPIIISEIRVLLTTKAKSWIQSKCSDNLWKTISMAPYHPPNCNPSSSLEAENSSEVARVLACCWGSRNPPTTFVMVDSFGQKIDILQTGYLNLPSSSGQQQLQRKMDDQHRLQKFILKYKPQVIIVGASTNMGCRFLKDTVKETLGIASYEDSQLSAVPVIYGDESIPSIYENSQVSSTEMPDESGIVRRAIALGRSFQNPLAFMASLCNPSKDIVALNLDSMQHFLTEDEIYRAIEQVMVTVTNQVGIDVNLAIEHEWLFAPLQFVSGLGPQRASLLKQLIRKLRWLPSRRKLLEYPYSFGKTIFTNCAGFLRIRPGPNMKSADEGNPLDDTRVHPELYDLANDLADHAVAKYQASMPSEMEVDPSGMAIECIRNNSGILTEEVVLDFFNLQKGVKDIKMEILKDIQAELIYGFKDYRGAYAWPSEDDVFRWLTGKNEVGTTVNATVCRVFQHRLVCVLGSGARGFIEKEDFTTEEIDDLRDLVSEGSSLTCRISGFLNDKFALQLTYKENDLELQDVQTTGSSFEHVTVSEKAENKLQKGGLLNRRKISHKLFQNISREDALKVLRESNGREVIFHPSSRGPSCLSMIFKFHKDIFVHKDITELEKDTADLTSFSKLGKLLKIDSSVYSNLDEVVSLYIRPLLSRLEEVQASKNYLTHERDVTHFLCQSNEAYTENLSYCLSLCQSSPGAITISYTTDGNIKQGRIDLHPEGYGFQGKMFRKIETLINYLSNVLTTSNRQSSDGFSRGRGGRGGRYGSGQRGRGHESGGMKDIDGNQCDNDGDWGIAADGTQNRGRGAYGQKGNFRGGRGRDNRGRGRRQFREGNDTHDDSTFWNTRNNNQGKSTENESTDDGWGLTNRGQEEGGVTTEIHTDDGWGCDSQSNHEKNSNFDAWSGPGLCHNPSDERRAESHSKSGWEGGMHASQNQGGDHASEQKETINRKLTGSGWGDDDGWGDTRKTAKETESGWGRKDHASEQKETINKNLTGSGWGDNDGWEGTKKEEKETESGWGDNDGWEGAKEEKETESGWGSEEHASKHKGTINKKPDSGWGGNSEWGAAGKKEKGTDSGWGATGKEKETDGGWGNGQYASEQKETIKVRPTNSGCGGDDGWEAAGKKEKGSGSGWGATGKEETDRGWGGDGRWEATGKKENETHSGWGGEQYPSQQKETVKNKTADRGWGGDHVWGTTKKEKESDSGWGVDKKKERKTDSGWGGDGGWEAVRKEKGTDNGWGCVDEVSEEKDKLNSEKLLDSGWGGDGAPGKKEKQTDTGFGVDGGWGAPEKKEKETDTGWGGDGGWGAGGNKGKQWESGWGTESNASGTEESISQTPSGGGWGNERGRGRSRGFRNFGEDSGSSRGGNWPQNDFVRRRGGGEGNWVQNESGRGSNGRGSWDQNESGRGRNGRGSWDQNESGRGRNGRGSWDQNESGRGRGGRAGRFQSGFDRGRGRARGNRDGWSRNTSDADWGGRKDSWQQHSEGSAFGEGTTERCRKEDDGWSVGGNQKSSWDDGWSTKQDDDANDKGNSVWGTHGKEATLGKDSAENRSKETDGWSVADEKKTTCESWSEKPNDATDVKESNVW